MPELSVIVIRVVIVVIGLGIWFLTQHLITFRPTGSGIIGDGIHSLTWRWHKYLQEHPRAADWLLILSSLGIDCVGLFVIYQSVFGSSVRPFIGLMILFSLRQICQAVSALPAPEGMIWRSPGVPSLLVTYGVSNDLFFSGHTAMAVYGATELGLWGGPTWILVGAAVALFETVTVLILRAHYTMDVYAGAVTAAFATWLSLMVGPSVDGWITRLSQFLTL
jgi:hypothetical protein